MICHQGVPATRSLVNISQAGPAHQWSGFAVVTPFLQEAGAFEEEV